MFARIFKPKWQHRNPSKRIQAIDLLDANDPALITLAKQDRVSEVRAAAVAKLSDISVLMEIVKSDQDKEVSRRAHLRLGDLLCGEKAASPPLSIRLSSLEKLRSNELIETILRHGKEAELRQRALALTSNPELLSERALHDPAVDVRAAALGLIDDICTLEQILKHSKKGDKRINQLARQRVKLLREDVDKKRQAITLSEELESLCQQGNHTTRHSALLKAKQQWLDLRDVIDDARRQAIENNITHLQQICDNYRDNKNSKQNAYQILEDINRELEQVQEFSNELEQRVQSALNKSESILSNATELEPVDEQILARRYQQAANTTRAHQARLKQNTQTAMEIRTFLDRMEANAEKGKYSTKKSITQLRTQWDNLAKPNSETLTKTLTLRFNQLFGQIDQKRAHAAEIAKQLEQSLNQMIENFTKAANHGQLNEAISLRDQIKHRLDNALGLSTDKRNALEQSFKSVFPRIRELQGWRNWGASEVRERLCIQAENLISSDQSAHKLAEEIRELRNEWKHLDHQGGPAAETLWERFNSACNQAYEPCRLAFEQEAKQRDENLNKKQQISEELTNLYKNTDWEQANWKDLVKKYNSLRQTWRQLGPINRSKGRETIKRYKKISSQLEKKLENQRQIGLQLRKQLIQQMEQLAEEENINKAIEQAKHAQSEWNKVVVRASRKTEQDLWKAFRNACDQIFERRNALHQAKRQALEENLKQKAELCGKLEALIRELSLDNLENSMADAERLQRKWETMQQTPPEKNTSLEHRFLEILDSFHLDIENIKRNEAQRLWDVLQRCGHLCIRLEGQLEKPTDVGAIKSEWNKLANLDEHAIHGLRLRFRAALSAIEGNDAARQEAIQKLRDNTERKRKQCLEMEILAGVESPPEHAEQRMELQISLLSERFDGQKPSETSAKSYEIALQAQRQWLTSGMLPIEEMQALEHRFSAAGKTMLKR